jgi:tetratricopeptide (TPR) repeat protein
LGTGVRTRGREYAACVWRALLVLSIAACSRAPHDPLGAISGDVRAGRFIAVAARIAAAELPDRPQLAFRAASDASAGALPQLASVSLEAELAAAAAERLEQELGPEAALAARERAAAAAPDRAEHHDGLARSRLAAGQRDAALAAWDRAAEIAPLQPVYRLAPIRALVALGDRERACTRAAQLAAAAGDVERLLVASNGAAACGDHARAVELARTALERRPDDGRLVFTLGERLAGAGDPSAVRVFADLLICGARGRAWHRHEAAARLVALATDAEASRRVREALDGPRDCQPVDNPDLKQYVESLRARLQ